MTSFTQRVWLAARKIPFGSVTTYKKIARAIGCPKAARAVGNALNKNKSKEVPCHRVVKSDGSLGGFAFGCREKKKLLAREGIEFEGARVKDFWRVLFTGF